MYLLDTNIVNALRNGDQAVIAKYERFADVSFVSSLVVEEILYIGYMAEINNIRSKRSRGNLTQLNEDMVQFIRDLSRFTLIPYTSTAEATFKTSESLKRRKMDGRIAAHALELGYTLITDNTRDFEQIPLLPLENWAR